MIVIEIHRGSSVLKTKLIGASFDTVIRSRSPVSAIGPKIIPNKTPAGE